MEKRRHGGDGWASRSIIDPAIEPPYRMKLSATSRTYRHFIRSGRFESFPIADRTTALGLIASRSRRKRRDGSLSIVSWTPQRRLRSIRLRRIFRDASSINVSTVSPDHFNVDLIWRNFFFLVSVLVRFAPITRKLWLYEWYYYYTGNILQSVPMFVVQSATGENKSKMWNKFCSFEALFSKKSALNLLRIRMHLTMSRLNGSRSLYDRNFLRFWNNREVTIGIQNLEFFNWKIYVIQGYYMYIIYFIYISEVVVQP